MPSHLAEAAALAAGTLVSEDLSCIAAGLLARRREMGLGLATAACAAGIYLGDMALWGAGRLFGPRLLAWPRLARALPAGSVDRARSWLGGRLPQAVLASRFMPGTRLPLYLVAGALKTGAGRFALWSLLAVLLWAPLLVLASAALGPVFTRSLEGLLGNGPLVLPAACAGAYVARRAGLRALNAARRALARAGGRLAAPVSRLWRWEFWPPWIFYAPLAPYLVWLSLRHRGFSTITAANPGIPHGGFVGESKSRILQELPARWVVPFALIEEGPVTERLERLDRVMADGGWSYPIILKPDAGQRGAGVRLARDRARAAACLAACPHPIVAQVYHPGPYEAGIFYYRLPGEPPGRILSITDKRFPEVAGDGRSKVGELVRWHPRCRMQARTFLARLGPAADRVPGAGEHVGLAVAGNHCQGTMFLDGSHLITPELERAVDALASRFEGFYFGRFDVRYADVEAFRAGRDLAIVELNGATSESTDLYDPRRSLPRAYGILFRQWRLLFAIGGRNRRAGAPVTPLRELLRGLRDYRARAASPLSD